jgi:hypothetical protein
VQDEPASNFVKSTTRDVNGKIDIGAVFSYGIALRVVLNETIA